jgi:hypothetical protein
MRESRNLRDKTRQPVFKDKETVIVQGSCWGMSVKRGILI